MWNWILFVFIYIIVSFYAFQAVRTLTRSPYVLYAYILVLLVVLGNFLYHFAFPGETRGFRGARGYAASFLLMVILFQLVTVIFLFGEDMVRMLTALAGKWSGKSAEISLPSRRRFVSLLGMGLAAIPFSGLLYGMVKGKYDFRVLKYVLEFDDLPDAFDGYRITQLSDIHSGSFDDHEKVSYAVDLINQQESDLLLFTGDMVNDKADELLPWMETFSRLGAPDGMYSVLGNHDYGDYARWGSEADKEANLDKLKELQRQMGFELLLNEHRYLEKDGQRIALIGVENWGAGGFKKAGDLDKAIQGMTPDTFKILMSHDPSHWEQQVINHPYHYHLTLSGHTHGMQFGVEIPGVVKWSPIKWRYKYWAGIYREMGQYINVNRGLGFLGYPGRVGMWPEITVIELKKSAKTA
ncbi:metallophosphoesterase [Sinomicrobium soli]|uniref:metallophosphoesterase n=1 Tax=Sinomicrobium sp. N-1-3-6 TaxID=2219864 RepID=UPI000DCB75B5|nr:metallophosphoesterase [Sinomicrobium sp. N-1-3-6]RAV28564.1 metallophosphoesterase [Sinomicrobium sp. N-1-3-6]